MPDYHNLNGMFYPAESRFNQADKSQLEMPQMRSGVRPDRHISVMSDEFKHDLLTPMKR